MQGDRRAGPSLQGFHIDSIWGQRALKQVYAAIMEVSPWPAAKCTLHSVLTLRCRLLSSLLLQRLEHL